MLDAATCLLNAASPLESCHRPTNPPRICCSPARPIQASDSHLKPSTVRFQLTVLIASLS